MPKQTWSPQKAKRLKKHGFLHRMRSRDGLAMLKRRRAKGRKSLAVAKSA